MQLDLDPSKYRDYVRLMAEAQAAYNAWEAHFRATLLIKKLYGRY